MVQIGKGNVPQNSICYYLPQTEIIIEATVQKTVQKPGPFANYAKRLLALNNVIIYKSEIYDLKNISVNYNIVPDTLKSFAVEINAKTTAYNLYLDAKKIIKGVNAASTSLSDRTDLTLQETQIPKCDTTLIFDYSVLSEEALMATSELKMAEIAAKQIFKIRESRMEILSGDSETEISSDALQLIISELDKAEKALVTLFEGKTKVCTETKTFHFLPKSAVENEVIFRFSPLLGIVENDDLAGRAITVSVLPQSNYSENLTATNRKIKKCGIFYNVSISAQVSVFDAGKIMAKNNFQMPQLGTLKFFPAELFDKKNTQIIFTEFGTIEFIKQ